MDLILADPPWLYSGAGTPGHGKADDHYGGMPAADVASDLFAARQKCKRDAWLVLWVTWPLLWEVMDDVVAGSGWEYLTGGSWHKDRARKGIGHHVEGDSELWTLWRKGRPRTIERFSNALNAKPGGHSQKPAEFVRRHVRAWSPEGGLVLDPYAGEHATFAKVCCTEGRRYIGAEVDPVRFDRAQKILKHWQEIS